MYSGSQIVQEGIERPVHRGGAAGQEADAGQLQLVVTVYLASFAAMSVLHGPISDAVGRRPVMAVSLTVYVAASVGAALAPSLGWLLVFRALQGLSAGGATIVSRTVNITEAPAVVTKSATSLALIGTRGATLRSWRAYPK
mgnify:CR=1 FL=1